MPNYERLFDPNSKKGDGEMIIHHYVIGGYPGDDVIRQARARDQVDYYIYRHWG